MALVMTDRQALFGITTLILVILLGVIFYPDHSKTSYALCIVLGGILGNCVAILIWGAKPNTQREEEEEEEEGTDNG